MKDFIGNELSVGDRVIYVQQGYREFRIGEVKRFTKCYVIVGGLEEIKQLPTQLILYKKGV